MGFPWKGEGEEPGCSITRDPVERVFQFKVAKIILENDQEFNHGDLLGLFIAFRPHKTALINPNNSSLSH